MTHPDRARIHDALTQAIAHGRLTLDGETIAAVCDALTAEPAPQSGSVAPHGPHSPSDGPQVGAGRDRAADARTDDHSNTLPDFIQIEPYRHDLGHQAWVARCWGGGPCDGWVSLDHRSEQTAQNWARRHTAEDHPDTSPDSPDSTRTPATGGIVHDAPQVGESGSECGPLPRRTRPDSEADASRTGPDAAKRDCPACEAGIKHTEHCPTPETHNWGCGCPTDQAPPAPDDALREQIVTALRTTPATGNTHKPGHERFDHHPLPGETGHNYAYTCALCRNDVDALADAVLAVRDRRREQLAAEIKELDACCNQLDADAEQLRTRAEQAEATVERVRKLVNTWASHCMHVQTGWLLAEVNAALDDREAPARTGNGHTASCETERTELRTTIARVRDLAARWSNALAPDRRYAKALDTALGTPPAETPGHIYLSTSCLHGDMTLPDGRTGHEYCQGDTGAAGIKTPAQCKFCAAPCICPCHPPQPAAEQQPGQAAPCGVLDVLLSRAARGVLTPAEGPLLRRHVEQLLAERDQLAARLSQADTTKEH